LTDKQLTVQLGLQQLRGIELVTHKGWSMEMKKTGTMSDDDPMEDLQHTALGKIMSECCIREFLFSLPTREVDELIRAELGTVGWHFPEAMTKGELADTLQMESIVELGPKADLQDCLETLSGACE
jgi:hypothetical protein